MVFATGAVSDQNRAAVATAFDACKSTRVVAVPNPGKRNGAMLLDMQSGARGDSFIPIHLEKRPLCVAPESG